MVAKLMTGFSLFKSMLDIAKGLKDINDASIRNAAVIELQEKILGAQALQASLVERVRDLEAQMASLKKWETEKKRYQLHPIVPGCLAYVLKRSKAKGEPPHAICPNCYDDGKKSILQDNQDGSASKHALVCPSCNTCLNIGDYRNQDMSVD